MAIEVADLGVEYSGMTTVDINQGSLWPNMFNRNWQAALMGVNKVVIQNPTYNTDPADRTREANFIKTPKEGSATQIELTVNVRREQANTFDYEDVEEAPIDWLNRTRMSQAATMAAGNAQSIDTAIFSAFSSLTFGAAQQFSLGKAGTDFIATAAPHVGSGKGYGLVKDAIRAFSLYMFRNNAIQPGQLIGGTVGTPFMVMQPELLIGFSDWLVDQGYSWDTLTQSGLVGNSVLGRGAYRGTLHGVELYSSNTMAVPATNKNWVFYGATDQVMTVAQKPTFTQIISPMENQKGPKWLLRTITRWGSVEINPVLKAQFTILGK